MGTFQQVKIDLMCNRELRKEKHQDNGEVRSVTNIKLYQEYDFHYTMTDE